MSNGVRWWQWLPLPWWRLVATVDAADEVPDRLPKRGAILVGSPAKPKWLAFDCPCRARHRVMVSLDSARRPRWSIRGAFVLSVSPSVDDRTLGTRCHYFIRNGRTVWARDSESPR
jgi:hypothetical protein